MGCFLQHSVPESIICFLEGKDFEDVVRLAVSLGGDADTRACITGAIAATVYPVPDRLAARCITFLPPFLRDTMDEFERRVSGRD